MRILRLLTLGGTVGLSTAVVCFVAADRVAHTSFPPPAPRTLAAAAPPAEPETTGTLVQGAEAPGPAPARMPGGFDTERLNALMRGEMPPPPAPAPVRSAARRR